MGPRSGAGETASSSHGPCCQKNLPHTTHSKASNDLVAIRRPGHPFNGQTLKVLNTTRRQGQRMLLVTLPDGSRSLVPVAWTDWDTDTPNSESPGPTTPPTQQFTIHGLLQTRQIVNALLHRLPTREESPHATGAVRVTAKQPSKPSNRSRAPTRSRRSSRRDAGQSDRPDGPTTHPERSGGRAQ